MSFTELMQNDLIRNKITEYLTFRECILLANTHKDFQSLHYTINTLLIQDVFIFKNTYKKFTIKQMTMNSNNLKSLFKIDYPTQPEKFPQTKIFNLTYITAMPWQQSNSNYEFYKAFIILSSEPYVNQLKYLKELHFMSKCDWCDTNHLSQTYFKKAIPHLTNLRVLNLSKHNIITLPSEIDQLKKLQVLLLNDTQLTTLPDELQNLHNLKKLDISNNKLITLPNCFKNMPNLEILHLTLTTDILENFDKIIHLMNLKELYIIGKFFDYSEFFISSTSYKSFKKRFRLNPNLKVLHISYMMMDPNPIINFKELQNLHSLTLHNCRITTIDQQINSFKKLKKLVLSMNYIKTYDLDLPMLEHLGLQFNKIESFFERIKNPQQLKYLDIRNNWLVKINDSIGEFTNLQQLVIYDNTIEYISPKIGCLENLKVIDINLNSAYKLPYNKKYVLKNFLVGHVNAVRLSLSNDYIEQKSCNPFYKKNN